MGMPAVASAGVAARFLGMGQLRTSELLAALSVALDLTEGQRAGHALRTTYLALRLADRIGLPSDSRRDLIRRHPQLSRQILAQIDLFSAVAEIAACHHERLHGKGYFRGLSAEALGLSARIVAVADVFEAMTSARPYRAAMTEERALAIMRQSSGDHLAGEVITALADVDSLAA